MINTPALIMRLTDSALTGAMELRIIKPSFKYVAGQWLFINIPEISQWQWHPVGTPCLPVSTASDHRCSSQSRLPLKTPTSPFTFVRLETGLTRLVTASVPARLSFRP